MVKKIEKSAREIAARRGVQLADFKIINADPPAQSDPSIIAAIEESASELSLTHRRMVSRAYHDSLFMARSTILSGHLIPLSTDNFFLQLQDCPNWDDFCSLSQRCVKSIGKDGISPNFIENYLFLRLQPQA